MDSPCTYEIHLNPDDDGGGHNLLSALQKIIGFRAMWEIIGGFYLIAYCFWYLPAANRVVPHWPLDLAFTLAAGSMLFFFGFKEVLRLLEKTPKQSN